MIEAMTGLIGQGPSPGVDSGEGSRRKKNGQPPGEAGPEEQVLMLRPFISGRARSQVISGHVETYVRRVLELGGTEVQPGTSKTGKDGLGDYLLVYNSGPRNYGAAATVSAKNAGLTLRLTRDDAVDVADRVTFRDVPPQHAYQINCPIRSDDAIDLAVTLTQRALAKIRGAGSNAGATA